MIYVFAECLLLGDCKQFYWFLIFKMDTPDDMQVLIEKHVGQISYSMPTENFILSVV